MKTLRYITLLLLTFPLLALLASEGAAARVVGELSLAPLAPASPAAQASARPNPAPTNPAETAESIRSSLTRAQLALPADPVTARQLVAEARGSYTGEFALALAEASPDADRRVREGFDAAEQALQTDNVPSVPNAPNAPVFAVARAQVWTSLLDGSCRVVVEALERGDGPTAWLWLPLREFRHATRFSRPDADATLAVKGVMNGTVLPQDALLSVRADLLDTYQARLTESLGGLPEAAAARFHMRSAEGAALAAGYFAILAPQYREQRGEEALVEAQGAFTELVAAALKEQNFTEPLAAVDRALQGFRAAPLSPDEQARRAGQLERFLALVPVEYGRGVRDG